MASTMTNRIARLAMARTCARPLQVSFVWSGSRKYASWTSDVVFLIALLLGQFRFTTRTFFPVSDVSRLT
jgi:hypothetical protein